MSDLASLLERVEKATGLSASDALRLDLEIYDALKPGGRVEPYTTSIDAALTLVKAKLPDREWGVGADHENRRHWATIEDDVWDEAMDFARGFAPTGALALLTALLRALIAQSTVAKASTGGNDGL